MKKILEVLQYGDLDIRFNTDFNPVKNPNVIPDITSRTAFAMMTRLWGGNEQSVLAMLRALAVADLAVSVNRKEMIRHFDEDSAAMARCFLEAKRDFEKRGGKMMVFGPGVKPSDIKS